MVSAAKAFEKEPPLQPLDNLAAIVEDFKWRYQDRNKTDQVVRYCADADNFPEAVVRACEARDEYGKHHNHQSKVDIHARRRFGRKIIKKTARGAIDTSSFEAFHDSIDEIKPYGIGPVTVYDVAVRVGAFLGIEPKSVYMHAGVRQGLRALVEALVRMKRPNGWILTRTPDPWRRHAVPLSWFPKPLKKLPADEVEDILCTYREVFEGWGRA